MYFCMIVEKEGEFLRIRMTKTYQNCYFLFSELLDKNKMVESI